MKTNQILMAMAAVAGLSLAATEIASAQATTVQTTATTPVETATVTRNVGTVSEFGPETVVIRSAAAPEPIRYSTTKTTTFVDENGVPVSVETVKTGVPVDVEYARVGDRLVARRVIVRRTVVQSPGVIEKKTTTTTTTTERR